MAGLSSSPNSASKPNIQHPLTLDTIRGHANGPIQSNVDVRAAAEHSDDAISSPAATTTRRASIPPQNTPNATLNLAPPRIQSHSPPTSSVTQVIVTKSGSTRDIDQDNGSMDKEIASNMLPSPGQSRRVSVDSYPSRHRLVVGVMLALGSGGSHFPVRSERLLNTLRSITSVITTAELTSYVLATVETGILKRFVNDRGETWFSLENPVQSTPSQDVVTSWIRSLVPSWF
jgi:hypothetical protein